MYRKIISFFLVLTFIFSSFTSAFAQDFSDMPLDNYWSYDALNDAINNGLIKGYENKINPKSFVTRAQVATILNRALGAIETADISSYTDISNTAWYANDMAKAVKMGIFKGDSNKKLLPTSNITRQETFVVIARVLKLNNKEINSLDKFLDKNDIAVWAKADVAALISAGYVNGSGNKLNPKDKITLEEFAQIMSNVINHYISKPGTYTEVGAGNVLINTTDVTLKNINISGDLIVGEGAANSDVTLDNVTVKGRLIVRGGGQNSIKLINKSNVGSIVIGKTASGAIRLKTEEGCNVDLVYIDDGNDDIIIEGVLNTVTVAADIPVVLNNAKVAVVSVSAQDASVKIEGNSTVQVAQIQNTAIGASIDVSKTATIQKVSSQADEVSISGEGKVVEAVISGNNTEINTVGTSLTVEQGTTGVIENGNVVKGDGNKTQTGSTTPVTPPTPSTPDEPSTPTVVSSKVNTFMEFKAAIENPSIGAIEIIKSFAIAEDYIFITNKPITVANGVILTIMSDIEVQNSFINNGTVVVLSEGDFLTSLILRSSDTTKCKFVNNGKVTNNGIVEIHESLVNNGIVENNSSLKYYDILGLRTDSIRTPVSNITGNGTVNKVAVVLSQTAFEAAFNKVENGKKYYTDYTFDYNNSIPNFDGTFTLPVGEISITSEFIISNTAKLIVPNNCTLIIEDGGYLGIFGELNILGNVINRGFYIKSNTGKIVGNIINEGKGDYSLAFKVTNIDEWNQAINNDRCFAVVVDGDIVINNNSTINANLIVNRGKTLTIATGKTLTVNIRYDKYSSYNAILGTLVVDGSLMLTETLCARNDGIIDNNGTIVLDNRAGLYMEYMDNDNHGTIDNTTGIIKLINGWARFEDENGNPLHGFLKNPNHVVETYANLADLAREIWCRGILPEATDADISSYAQDFVDWNDMGDNDRDGIKAISMLIKNRILSGTTVDGKKYIYPYDTISKKDIAVILYDFIQKAIEAKGFEDINTGAGVAFTDISNLTESEKTAIDYLSKAGVLLDNSAQFNPNDVISTVWRNPDGTEINGGSDICKLVNNIFDKLTVAAVSTEKELIDAINSDDIQTIKLNGDITLTNSLTITKRVELLKGKSLTVATGKNLTIDRQDQVGHGELFIAGTLNIPDASTLFNYTTILVDKGTINNSGNYIDINGVQGSQDSKCGYLEIKDGVLNNNGTFDINSHVRLTNTVFTHTANIFTNNGNLFITGGSLNVTSEFHNAGYMAIRDIYSSTNDNITQINFGSNLTDDSNWIDYIALVYDENALYASIKAQDSKISALADKDKVTGLETYNRIDICENITVNNDITINNADIWIENNEEEQKSVQLVAANKISLKNSTIHVCDSLINHGEIILGTLDNENNPETYGGIQVWPYGTLLNNSKITNVNGRVLRMDDLKPFDNGLTTTKGKIDGTINFRVDDLAIVHDFLGLKTASISSAPTYERIDIMRYMQDNENDIELKESLQIDADMYIEWGNGIEVPENMTLSFTGSDHNIDNQGDVWVYGTLNLGSGYRFNNGSKIQIGGGVDNSSLFVNDGIIVNRNNIEILSGTLTNDGAIHNQNKISVQNNGVINGSGNIYEFTGSSINITNDNIVNVVDSLESLKATINSVNKTLIINNINVDENISITSGTLMIGMDGFGYGELSVGKNSTGSLEISDGAKIAINDGALVIDCQGNVTNNGTVNVGAKGTLRIENGGKLATNSDIDFSEGDLYLYDWENMQNYITGNGKIITYADRAQFVDQAFTILYDYDENGGSPVITPSAIGVGHVVSGSAIEYELNGGVKEWFDNREGVGSNNQRRYAYSAMIANGFIASINDLEGSHNPYLKVTYSYIKSIIDRIISNCNISLDDTDTNTINNMFTDLNAIIRNNDGSLFKLIQDIMDILIKY